MSVLNVVAGEPLSYGWLRRWTQREDTTRDCRIVTGLRFADYWECHGPVESTELCRNTSLDLLRAKVLSR